MTARHTRCPPTLSVSARSSVISFDGKRDAATLPGAELWFWPTGPFDFITSAVRPRISVRPWAPSDRIVSRKTPRVRVARGKCPAINTREITTVTRRWNGRGDNFLVTAEGGRAGGGGRIRFFDLDFRRRPDRARKWKSTTKSLCPESKFCLSVRPV